MSLAPGALDGDDESGIDEDLAPEERVEPLWTGSGISGEEPDDESIIS